MRPSQLTMRFGLNLCKFDMTMCNFFLLGYFQSTNILQVYYIGNVTRLVSCHTDETDTITNEVPSELKFDITMYKI